MALTDDDVREILRLIDESELDELRIETGGFKLHVRRGAASPAAEPVAQAPAPPSSDGATDDHRRPDARARSTARGPRRGAVRGRRRPGRAGHRRLPHRGHEDDELGAGRGRRDDRRGLRRGRAAGRRRRAAVPGPRHERRRRDRRHHDARRQPEPVGRDRADDARTCSRSRRRWTASASARCDFTSSTHMAVSVRFHREDPWERLRLVSAAMPDTPLDDHDRHALHLVGAGRRGRDARCRSAARCATASAASRSPTRRTTRPRWCGSPAMAREEGVEEVVIGLTYSISPVHTHEYYAERAGAIGGVARHRPALPEGPRRAADPGRRARAGARVHRRRSRRGRSSCTATARSGWRRWRTWRACAPAFGTLHTAVAPVANGTSNPPAETTLRNLEARASRTRSTSRRWRRCPSTSARSRATSGLPLGAPAEYDAAYYRHQMPGGMVTTMRRKLAEVRRPELFDAALEEVARVREEFG